MARKSAAYHQNRIARGGAIAGASLFTSIPGTLGVVGGAGYAGYHMRKLNQVQNKNPRTRAKVATHAPTKKMSRQPIKTAGRVRVKG